MAMASSAPACAASELVAKGRKSAAFLQAMLGQQPAAVGCVAAATPHDLQDLAEEILRCCDRALAALRGTTEEAAPASASSGTKRKPEHGSPAPPPATSSKRKRVSRGEKATRVEKKWTMEDGFIWRKYGQKDILGSKYPRLYFRCSYKDDHGCMARRQVQQSEADPSIYLISYFGEHTCRRDDDVAGAGAESPVPFVINFGATTRDGGQPSGSPWPSCDEDGRKPSGSPWPSCDEDGRQPSGSPWPSCDEDGGQPSGLPWPSSNEDGGLVVSETLVYHSPEEKELQSGNVSELIEQSTPVPELTCMSSWEWDPLYRCLFWDIGFGESLLDDIAGFTHLDYVGLFQ